MSSSSQKMVNIGKLNLEGLMSRAEILFSSGYKFCGELDVVLMKKSFEHIVAGIDKFNFKVDFRQQSDFDWVISDSYGEIFSIIETDDLDNAFNKLSADAFNVRSASGHFPLNMVLIKSTIKQSDEFIISLLCSHEYLDARSSATIFDFVIRYYNAQKAGAEQLANEIANNAKLLHSIDAQQMIKRLQRSEYDFEQNLDSLVNYPVNDTGEHGVSINTLNELLPSFKARRRVPVHFSVNIKALVEKCRQYCPEVTKNAVITAALNKAFYQVNCDKKGILGEQIISGKMLSDLLTPEQRSRYIGNYIAFVPFTTQGQLPIEELAKVINNRICLMREKQLDLSCFELVEQLANDNVIGSDDEPFSYIVTNWNNYYFLESRDYLSGCKSLAHLSGVNVDPVDNIGAALINRPVIVINLSFDDELYVSMFPSLRNDDENHQLLEAMAAQFAH